MKRRGQCSNHTSNSNTTPFPSLFFLSFFLSLCTLSFHSLIFFSKQKTTSFLTTWEPECCALVSSCFFCLSRLFQQQWLHNTAFKLPPRMRSNAPPAARFPHHRHPLRRRQPPPPPTALPRRPLLQALVAVALTITPLRRHPLNTSTPLRRRRHHPAAVAAACITRRQTSTTPRRHRRTQLSLIFRFTTTPLRRRPRRLLRR